jgi:hypothetical protein
MRESARVAAAMFANTQVRCAHLYSLTRCHAVPVTPLFLQTKDLARAHRIAAELEAGEVLINGAPNFAAQRSFVNRF